MQVSLCKLTKQGNEAVLRFRVYCKISRGVRGGAGITLHSGISLHNSLEVWLCVGVYQNWLGTSQAEKPQVTQVLLLCHAVLCCPVCLRCFQAQSFNTMR